METQFRLGAQFGGQRWWLGVQAIKRQIRPCPAMSSDQEAQQQGKCPFGVSTIARPKQGSTPDFSAVDHKPFMKKRNQGSFKLMMGLESMDWEDWIELDDAYLEDMAQRRHLVKNKRSQVIRSTPLAGSANRELLELLVEYLPRRFPNHFRHQDGLLENMATAEIWNLNDCSIDPLNIVAQLVQEDLILLAKDSDDCLRFVSGAVLFPQRWDLAEKIGHELDFIHAPVPRYKESLSRPVNAFMERVSSKRPFWRSNWTVCAYEEKFAPLLEQDKIKLNEREVPLVESPITAENAGRRLFTRVERQAVFRLPESGAVLFSVHTFVKPLHRLEARPEEAAQLAASVRALPPDIQLYKSIELIREPLLCYLDAISQ